MQSFDTVKNAVPTVAVAALFQKDPQALIAHPGQGYDDFASLRTAPVVLIAKDAQFTWWQWLKARHGFRDEQLRPYNYALGPFLANSRAVQQGYSVAEPIAVEREAHFTPVIHLLADHGFSTYSTLIEARTEMVRDRPDLVQRFVDASIGGWYNYLYSDHGAADALMLEDNPELTADELEASRMLLRSQGIVDSGDALELGIGAMNPARVKDFYDAMVGAGLYRAGEVDLSRVADFQFVNKGVGLDLKARLLGEPHASRPHRDFPDCGRVAVARPGGRVAHTERVKRFLNRRSPSQAMPTTKGAAMPMPKVASMGSPPCSRPLSR